MNQAIQNSTLWRLAMGEDPEGRRLAALEVGGFCQNSALTLSTLLERYLSDARKLGRSPDPALLAQVGGMLEGLGLIGGQLENLKGAFQEDQEQDERRAGNAE